MTDAKTFVNILNGQIITHVWRGYGSAIFIELGKLTKDENRKQPHGEFTISIEWSWRVENNKSIVLGSWSDNEDINKISSLLQGFTIQNISFFARQKEIEIELKENLFLSSFATAKGEPEWAIKSKNKWLFFKNGEFVIQEST